MKKALAIILVAMVASAAFANKYVIVKGGEVKRVVSVYGKNAKANNDKNQYTDAQWAAFNITSEPPYIVKDGAVWRDMTEAETNTVNEALQQEMLDEADDDVDMDALFKTIAKAVKDNLTTKNAVKQAFKQAVDPKKAKNKKKKNKKNK